MSARIALLRRVGVASTVLAYALVVWGAIVRINGAGMTCPDWPRCRGVWFPALDPKVVYEFYHRVGAAGLSAAVLATFVAACFARSRAPAAFKAAWVSLGLIVAQVIAGAVTIAAQNNPPSVAVHLVLGFCTFISLLMVTLIAYEESAYHKSAPAAQAGARPSGLREPAHGTRVFPWLVLVATMLAFLAVFSAGWMAAANDGLACTAIPLCGATGPLTVDQQIHMSHRYAAYATVATAFVVWAVAVTTQRDDRSIPAAAWVVFGLVVLQAALGFAAVATRLQPVIRSAHEANAALLAAALVVTTYLAFRRRPASG